MLNVILYLVEGQPLLAALSSLSLIPGFSNLLAGVANGSSEISPKIIIDNASKIIDIANKISGKIEDGGALLRAVQSIISEAKAGKGIAANLIQSALQRTEQSKVEVSNA